jgi:ribosomal protein S18 acetylase RimI-like enzyme
MSEYDRYDEDELSALLARDDETLFQEIERRRRRQPPSKRRAMARGLQRGDPLPARPRTLERRDGEDDYRATLNNRGVVKDVSELGTDVDPVGTVTVGKPKPIGIPADEVERLRTTGTARERIGSTFALDKARREAPKQRRDLSASDAAKALGDAGLLAKEAISEPFRMGAKGLAESGYATAQGVTNLVAGKDSDAAQAVRESRAEMRDTYGEPLSALGIATQLGAGLVGSGAQYMLPGAGMARAGAALGQGSAVGRALQAAAGQVSGGGAKAALKRIGIGALTSAPLDVAIAQSPEDNSANFLGDVLGSERMKAIGKDPLKAAGVEMAIGSVLPTALSAKTLGKGAAKALGELNLQGRAGAAGAAGKDPFSRGRVMGTKVRTPKGELRITGDPESVPPPRPKALADENLGRIAAGLAKRVADKGGFTFDPHTGKFVAKGYAVALGKESGVAPTVVDQLTPETIRDFLTTNGRFFAENPNVKIGAWKDEAGKIWLEPSEVLPDRRAAVALGLERNELAVGDLGKYARNEDGTISLERVPFEHRSPVSGLATLSGKYQGTNPGVKGAERARANRTPRVYVQDVGSELEPEFRSPSLSKYDVEVPKGQLYDVTSDPDRIVAKIGGNDPDRWERAIEKAGYAGYYASGYNPHYKALFGDVPVAGAAQPSRPVTAPRVKEVPTRTVEQVQQLAVKGRKSLENAGYAAQIKESVKRGLADVLDALATVPHAASWYKADLKRMDEVMREIIPELQNPVTHQLFRAVLAITSSGQNPLSNLKTTIGLTRKFLDGGEDLAKLSFFQSIPVRTTGEKGGLVYRGTLDKSIPSSPRYHNHEEGLSKLKAFLGPDREQWGAKLEQLWAERRVSKHRQKGAKESIEFTVPLAAEILGPKIGRYYANLSGVAEDVTVDVWAARTLRRWLGYARVGTESKAAPTDVEGNVMRAAIAQLAQKATQKTGRRFDPMEIQALLWYYEKQRYADLGARDSGQISYADAADIVRRAAQPPARDPGLGAPHAGEAGRGGGVPLGGADAGAPVRAGDGAPTDGGGVRAVPGDLAGEPAGTAAGHRAGDRGVDPAARPGPEVSTPPRGVSDQFQRLTIKELRDARAKRESLLRINSFHGSVGQEIKARLERELDQVRRLESEALRNHPQREVLDAISARVDDAYAANFDDNPSETLIDGAGQLLDLKRDIENGRVLTGQEMDALRQFLTHDQERLPATSPRLKNRGGYLDLTGKPNESTALVPSKPVAQPPVSQDYSPGEQLVRSNLQRSIAHREQMLADMRRQRERWAKDGNVGEGGWWGHIPETLDEADADIARSEAVLARDRAELDKPPAPQYPPIAPDPRNMGRGEFASSVTEGLLKEPYAAEALTFEEQKELWVLSHKIESERYGPEGMWLEPEDNARFEELGEKLIAGYKRFVERQSPPTLPSGPKRLKNRGGYLDLTGKPQPNEPRITADDSKPGFKVLRYHAPNGDVAGEMTLYLRDDGTSEGQSIWVERPFRRQGIATALYREAERLGYKPTETAGKLTKVTADGEQFLASLKKPIDADDLEGLDALDLPTDQRGRIEAAEVKPNEPAGNSAQARLNAALAQDKATIADLFGVNASTYESAWRVARNEASSIEAADAAAQTMRAMEQRLTPEQLERLDAVGQHYGFDVRDLQAQARTEQALSGLGKPRLKNRPGFLNVGGGRSPKLPNKTEGTGTPYKAKVDVTEHERALSNLKKLNLSPEAEAKVRDAYTRLDLEKKVVTHAETQAVADELGLDPRRLLDKEGRLSGAELLAIRDVISSNAKRIVELSTQAQNPALGVGDKDALLKEIGQLTGENDQFLRRYTKQREQAGRDLNALRIIARNSLDAPTWLLQAERLKGLPLTQDEHVLISQLAAAQDRDGLIKAVAGMRRSSGQDKLVTLWKAGLLTSLGTHAANISGNAAMAVAESVKEVPAALVDALLSLARGTARTKAPSIRGLVVEPVKGLVGPGMRAARRVLKYGADASELSKWDFRRTNYGNSPAGRFAQAYTDAVFNTLGAEDQLFRAAAVGRSLEEQARLIAKKDKALLAQLRKQPTPAMMVQAIADAEVAVFQNPNLAADAVSSVRQNLRAKGKAGETAATVTEVVAPFVKTPSNIVSRTIEYSPPGLAYNTAKLGIALAKGVTAPDQKRLAEAMGRGLVGSSTLFLLGFMLAREGKATGSAPKQANERSQWELEGKIPNGVLVGDTWRSFSRLGPPGMVIATGAQAYEAFANNETASGKIFGALYAPVRAGLDQSFLQGVSGALDALNDPTRAGERLLESTVGSVIPSGIAQVARAGDPLARERSGVLDALQARVPGLRNQLPAKLNVFGKPVREGGPISDMLDPTRPTAASQDPLIQALAKADAKIGFPSKTVTGPDRTRRTLTPEEYRAHLREVGPRTEAALRELLQAGLFNDARETPDDRRDAVQSTVTKVRAAASRRRRAREAQTAKTP